MNSNTHDVPFHTRHDDELADRDHARRSRRTSTSSDPNLQIH
jgi:hypothetical protein